VQNILVQVEIYAERKVQVEIHPECNSTGGDIRKMEDHRWRCMQNAIIQVEMSVEYISAGGHMRRT
jgi:hypothetical protein